MVILDQVRVTRSLLVSLFQEPADQILQNERTLHLRRIMTSRVGRADSEAKVQRIPQEEHLDLSRLERAASPQTQRTLLAMNT
jgi:hypothetical protein